MDLNQYQIFASRTMPDFDDKGKANYALGLNGEAGELGDLVKKNIFHGHQNDREAFVNEAGDVLHYLSGLCLMYGVTLEEAAMANIKKLQKRFPNGFNTLDSIRRVDVNGKD